MARDRDARCFERFGQANFRIAELNGGHRCLNGQGTGDCGQWFRAAAMRGYPQKFAAHFLT